jgi:excisionase family DNA binding protein
MSKNGNIILKVLEPLVDSKVISSNELSRIRKVLEEEVAQPAKPNPKPLPESKPESFKTVKETSKLLRVDRKTVYNWMMAGKLEFTKLSPKKVLIYEDSIFALLKKCKNKKDNV